MGCTDFEETNIESETKTSKDLEEIVVDIIWDRVEQRNSAYDSEEERDYGIDDLDYDYDDFFFFEAHGNYWF